MNTLGYRSNDYDSVVSSNYGARSNPKFVKKERKLSVAPTFETV